VSRYCRRCGRAIPPGQGVIISAQEGGSGAPVALYAHRGECPPEEPTAVGVPSPPPVGFRR
jgi:hypothetical protein